MSTRTRGPVRPPVTKTQPTALIPAGVYTSDSAEYHNGAVVSISRPASDVGVSILKQGGNAVDAAVATAFALAVTYPAAGNIGGGGFMLIHPAPGRGDPVVIDYRETAPARATSNMFLKKESQYLPKSVAVPGTVRGMAMAHQRFGTLPWKQLLQPAIELAKNGYNIDPYFAILLNDVLTTSPNVAELQRVYGRPGGGAWRAGDRLIQADLGGTLQLLADQGPDAFYTGLIAQAIVAEMNRADGIISLNDLEKYQAIQRQPLTTRYRNAYDVYVPPPPSSGGICLIEELNMLQTFDLSNWDRWSPQLLHVMTEIMRRAGCDRARFIGDPAVVQIPAELATPEYAQTLSRGIDLHKATPSQQLAPEIPISAESENTTHFSVIDKAGMAVANTYTLERIWGSRIVVQRRGFLLNNDMRAFNIFPGITTTAGTIGTTANTIAPGKRPISSQMPTIVAKDGRVILITGSPGSQAIPNTILCILVSTLDYQLPLHTAVESPRLSNQWLPDQITFEAPERYPELTTGLKTLGHLVIRTGPLPQGDAHSIWVAAPNDYIPVADHRRNGVATVSGY